MAPFPLTIGLELVAFSCSTEWVYAGLFPCRVHQLLARASLCRVHLVTLQALVLQDLTRCHAWELAFRCWAMTGSTSFLLWALSSRIGPAHLSSQKD